MNFLHSIFDKSYYPHFNKSTENIPLLKWMYICCIPLSKLLITLKIHPTHITTASFVLSLVSIFFLITSDNPYLFQLFWLLGLAFDISDGIVARATRTSSAIGSFYDHYTDIIKLILLFFAIGYKYNTSIIWATSFLTCSLFLLMAITNHMLAHRRHRLAVAGISNTAKTAATNNNANKMTFTNKIKAGLNRNTRLKALALNIRSSLFVIQGNSMLFLLPVSINSDWAIYSLIYFIIITMRAVLNSIKSSIQINSLLTRNQIPWK